MMHYKEFVEKLIDITENYNTSYMLGQFGQPTTKANITRAVGRQDVNNKPYLEGANTILDRGFMFDCICLIKGILWGWNGDLTKQYGGAVYKSNGVPDVGADSVLNYCHSVSTDFSDIKVGEIVWIKGHVGIYVGNNLVVECTPKWGVTPGVKYSYLSNKGNSNYPRTKKWDKHGMLPWIDYTEKQEVKDTVSLRYQKIEEVPEWGKEAVQYFIDNKSLQGDSKGNLDLSRDMLRLLVIFYRCKGD